MAGKPLAKILQGLASQYGPGLLAGGGGKPKPGNLPDIAAQMAKMFAQKQEEDPDNKSSGLDNLQFGLDVAGVADPTPIADGVNAAISLARASKSDTPEERKKHLTNALISGISTVPYVGDLAKLFKYGGKGAKAAAKGAGGAESAAKTFKAATPTVDLAKDAGRSWNVPEMAGKVIPQPIAARVVPEAVNDVRRGRSWNLASQIGDKSPPVSSGKAPGERTVHDVVGGWLNRQRMTPDSPGLGNPITGGTTTGNSWGPGKPPVRPPGPSPAGGGGQPPVRPPGAAFPTGPAGGGGQGGWKGALQSIMSGGGGGPDAKRDLAQGLLAGGAAGAAAGYLSYDPKMPPRKHSLLGAIGGPDAEMSKEKMGHFVTRGVETAKTVMNPFTPPVAKIATTAKAILDTAIEMPGAILDWGQALKDSKRHLVQFNGVIAGAYMASERRDILRNIESGKKIAGSTKNLSESLSDFKDELQPIRDTLTIAINTLSAVALDMGTGILSVLKSSAKTFIDQRYYLKIMAEVLKLAFPATTGDTSGSLMMDHFMGGGRDPKTGKPSTPVTKRPKYI